MKGPETVKMRNFCPFQKSVEVLWESRRKNDDSCDQGLEIVFRFLCVSGLQKAGKESLEGVAFQSHKRRMEKSSSERGQIAALFVTRGMMGVSRSNE